MARGTIRSSRVALTGALRRTTAATPATSAPAASAAARPHAGQVPGRHDRVGRQPVHLGLVEQQEERAGAADAVVRVARRRGGRRSSPALVQRSHPRSAARPQLVERAELDRVGRARLRARGLQAVLQAVVAERALPRAPVAPRAGRSRRTGTPTRSSRSRCRCPAARRPCRTRCGTARRSGTTSRHAAVGAVLADVGRS